MAGDTDAAEAANAQVDIIGHVLDQNYLELPFVDSHHLLAGKLALPSIPPFELGGVVVDLSITRHIAIMWVASLLLIFLMIRSFRKPSAVPTGLANLFEVIVVFIRDEVVLPNMGEHGRKYMPFFLTVFFFILFCNLIGLFPYSATATGNISVTAALALCTFAVTQITGIVNNGFIGYCRSLIPSGMPAWLLPIMIPIEIMGLLSKPFALAIRLFANMIAGHVAILVFLGLIIMMKMWYLAFVSVPLAAALYLLEIFIAFVQAFIFTLLSALFINMAAHPDH